MIVSIFSFGVALTAPNALAITIPTVPVGDVGNPNDPATGNFYGGVSYAYNIGKYEVTVGQYTAFLNAVAADDTYAVYPPNMASDLNIAGISRSGSSGSYTYSTFGSPNHPVYVSWGDAAGFANWLHNGQPTGAQNASTTEDGAYFLNGATSTLALMAVTRRPGALWFIPTESEWYKAAYYQPAAAGGDSDSYWLYPMKTNNEPFSDQPPGSDVPLADQSHTGNFFRDVSAHIGYNDGYAVTGSSSYISTQNYLTDVGAYTSSPSYYGTFDQGGNTGEWNEAAVTSASRGARGGAYNSTSLDLRAAFRDSADPMFMSVGFRVASVVPEPGTVTLCLAGVFILAIRTKRR